MPGVFACFVPFPDFPVNKVDKTLNARFCTFVVGRVEGGDRQNERQGIGVEPVR